MLNLMLDEQFQSPVYSTCLVTHAYTVVTAKTNILQEWNYKELAGLPGVAWAFTTLKYMYAHPLVHPQNF